MLIFDNKNLINESSTVEVEPKMGYSPDMVGGLQIMTESAQAWDKLQESLFITEASLLMEGASEEVINENVFTNFFAKVKKFFQDVWAKIKGIWSAFLTNVKILFAGNDKNFVKKFEKQLRQKASDLSKYEYKHHEWKLEVGSVGSAWNGGGKYDFTKVSSITGADKKEVEDLDEKLEDAVNDFCASVVSGADKDDLIEKFNEAMKGDETESTGLTRSEIDVMLEAIKGSSKDMKEMEKLAKEVDKMFNLIIKDIESAESKIKTAVGKNPVEGSYKTRRTGIEEGKAKSGEYSSHDVSNADDAAVQQKFLQTSARYHREIQSIASSVFSASMSLFKQHISEQRRILEGALRFNPKSVQESAMVEEFLGWEA